MIGSFSWKQKLPRARLDIQSCSFLVYTSVGAIWEKQFKLNIADSNNHHQFYISVGTISEGQFLTEYLYHHLQNFSSIVDLNNPHQLFWSTSVEVDKAGFPALKEDLVPSAKLPCCFIQVLNSKYCQKRRSNSKDCQKRRFNHVELPADKIESLESTSAQQRAWSQISNEVKEEIAVSSRNHFNWLASDGVISSNKM